MFINKNPTLEPTNADLLSDWDENEKVTPLEVFFLLQKFIKE